MRTPEEELVVLRRRYIRMLKFDRVVFAIYGLTALLPLYALVARGHDKLFHAVAAILALVVGVAGWVIDSRILRRATRSEVGAYAVTAAFVVSRLFLGVWAVTITHNRLIAFVAREGVGDSSAAVSISFSESVRLGLNALLNPGLVWLVFPVVFYRVLYHISVHFLLRIHRLDAAATHEDCSP